MPTTDAIKPDKAPLLKPVMLPHLVLRDFLDEKTVAGLLDHANSHRSEFYDTILRSGAVNQVKRVSKATRDLGEYRDMLKKKILDLVPELIAQLRVTPIDSPKVELELVAHGDGAFYKRHIDTQKAFQRERIRVLSGVYYFHAQPKAFTGGALRLYAIGDPAGQTFIDIEPVHNSLLVFPSWAPHEVMPVSCPSQRFMDSRFAINCWVNNKKPQTTA